MDETWQEKQIWKFKASLVFHRITVDKLSSIFISTLKKLFVRIVGAAVYVYRYLGGQGRRVMGTLAFETSLESTSHIKQNISCECVQ